MKHLAERAFYEHTWRADSSASEPRVLRLFATAVQDDDLGSRARSIRDELAALVSALDIRSTPPSGLEKVFGTWLGADWCEDGRWLALIRPWFPITVIDRFPPGAAESLPLALWRQLARCVDGLGEPEPVPSPAPNATSQLATVLNPMNWMLHGNQLVVVDDGVAPFSNLIEASFDGPRPIRASFPLPRAAPRIVRFAAVYHYLRTGRELYTGLPWPTAKVWDVMRGVAQVVHEGVVPVPRTPAAESSLLVSVLRDPGAWSSCEALVEALSDRSGLQQ